MQQREKHQIYYTQRDYSLIIDKYKLFSFKKYTSEQLIIVAKGYFIEQRYPQTIQILNKIQHKYQAKIMFEKYALLFKATYLNKYNQPQLIKILDQFNIQKNHVKDKKFLNYHLTVFQQFRSFLETYQDQNNKAAIIQENEKSQSTKDKTPSRIKTVERQFSKQHNLEGFPCYLIQKKWRIRQQKYLLSQKSLSISHPHPGPIANLSLINHIFEIQPYEQKSKQYLNTILFPGTEYQVVSKKHWNYLNSIYKGIQVKKVFNKINNKQNAQITWKQKDVTRLSIKIQNIKDRFVLQVPTNSLFSTSVIPHLWKNYEHGQLKQEITNKKYVLIQDGPVREPKHQKHLKYIVCSDKNVHQLTKLEKKFFYSLLSRYDFQKYSINNSQSSGLVGLTNDSFLCYMNSSIQTLSQTFYLTKAFVENQYTEALNYTAKNVLGSRGQVTCAYADIIKKLWCLFDINGEVNGLLFKETFAKRFSYFLEDSQEDAHEFLNFLLNCTHDDLNTKNIGIKQKMIVAKNTSDFLQVKQTFIKNYEQANSSIISKLFSGYTFSHLCCLQCKSSYYNFDTNLTFPLPLPSQNPSIEVLFISSQRLLQDAQRYHVYTNEFKNVQDLINIMKKDFNKRDKPTFKYFLLGISKKAFKLEDIYDPSINLAIIKMRSSKVNLILYQTNTSGIKANTSGIRIPNKIKSGFYQRSNKLKEPIKQSNGMSNKKQKGIQIKQNKTNINITSESNISAIQKKSPRSAKENIQQISPRIQLKEQKEQQLISQSSEMNLHLVLLQFKYSESHVTYPRLMYLNPSLPEDVLRSIAMEYIPFQQISHSSHEKQLIYKTKLQKSKYTPIQYVLRVYLRKKVNLAATSSRPQMIGNIRNDLKFDLTTCFKIYGEVEKIAIQEQWRCQKCKTICPAQKQQKLYSVGPYLIIVLKRFKQGAKIYTKIQYPIQNLDISEFMYSSQQKSSKDVEIKYLYNLYGVIIHRGNMNRGHYYTYCRNKPTGKWFLFDDQDVKQVQNIQDIVSENAYILFYQRK